MCFIQKKSKVNLRFQNSLTEDPDMRITVKLANFLFLTVNLNLI